VPPEPVNALTARAFGALSHLRGRRCFHPHGVGFAATLVPRRGTATGAELFDSGRERPGRVRLSRSLGLPEMLPDPCGLALRIDDAYGPGLHQDLLLVSSGSAPIARHLLLPSWGFGESWYSTLLPYNCAARRIVVGARPAVAQHRLTLAELTRRDVAGLGFELAIATASSPWTAVAELRLERRVPDEGICFDPGNTGGGLELAGALNRLRLPAYRGSQRGRDARPDAGGDADEPDLRAVAS
jgi:hypothetical protein